MALEITRFTFRVDDNTLEKIKLIAKRTKRSINAQIEFILEQYLEQYEKQNGKISLERD